MTETSAYAGFPPGTVLLDKYRILRELGVGGMGVVVCAEHLTLGTLVAMKFLLPEFAALPDAADQFIREAKAATRVQSEHIVRVLDVGTLPPGAGPGVPSAPEQPFIVMEYLEGNDLGQLLKAGQVFSIHEAIEYTVQAAEALARAHRSGLIHRDVKPANLFLTSRPDGFPFVKMLDFGISKLVEEAAQQNVELTNTQAVMGSALYMSLEQMRSTKTVDHRTDIYALGVTLYELLSRTHPFTAASFSELVVKVSLDPPDPIRRHRPEVSEELAEIIARAYARYPDGRYPTVGVFAAALAPFAAVETQSTIEAIQRFERLSSGEIPMVRTLTPLNNRAVTVERPRRIPWVVIGSVALVAAAVTGAVLLTRKPPPVTLDPPDAGRSADPVIPAPSSAPVITVASGMPLNASSNGAPSASAPVMRAPPPRE